MNLIVATRLAPSYLRLDAQGRWRYGDALALAYHVKAASLRARLARVLVDLQGIAAAPGVEGEFLICNRLGRALPTAVRAAVLCHSGTCDSSGEEAIGAGARIAVFTGEQDALSWLLRP